ncbi:MAG TPA: RAD55 family ATPase, partial [Gammaproteobacteria bacterium]|nr:RAD55 family ATPase [Gammaproteobacteria bacterium]
MTIMQRRIEDGRLRTGVPGLDTILDGGLIPGSVYIIQGSPGAGKTILANQICFHHAHTGSKALYVTLLAESHDRLLAHLSQLTFFDGSQVPDSIYFISGFDTLSRDGLKGILHLLRSESRARDASLIVLDGLFALEETAQSAKEFRKFINDLTTLSMLIGCTVLLLTNNARRSVESVE